MPWATTTTNSHEATRRVHSPPIADPVLYKASWADAVASFSALMVVCGVTSVFGCASPPVDEPAGNQRAPEQTAHEPKHPAVVDGSSSTAEATLSVFVSPGPALTFDDVTYDMDAFFQLVLSEPSLFRDRHVVLRATGDTPFRTIQQVMRELGTVDAATTVKLWSGSDSANEHRPTSRRSGRAKGARPLTVNSR